MTFSFSEADFTRIDEVLNCTHVRDERANGTLVRYQLSDPESGRRLALELLQDVDLPAELNQLRSGTLISVYASDSFLQLHRCTGYIASKELGEVIFFARTADAISGLVVEREAGCSLYANVDHYLLSSDFTRLPPELIMSSVALSLTESIFTDLE